MGDKTIALFGSFQPVPDDPAYSLAYEIGLRLAKAGFDLINGGHDGTMAASSKGAREGGAYVTGVTCPSVRSARRVDTNPYLSEVIEAPDLLTRINIMMRRSSGYVIMPGGTGTLAELGVVWEHVHKGFISPRPIACLGNHWASTIDAASQGYVNATRHISVVETAEAAVSLIRDRAVEVSAEDRTFSGN